MDVTGKTKIWRNEKNGRVWYTRTISSRKYEDGKTTDEWIKTYENVQLPKDVNLENGTLINVTNGFEAVTEYKDKIYRRLVVMEYEVVEEGQDEKKQDDEPIDDFEALDEDVPF